MNPGAAVDRLFVPGRVLDARFGRNPPRCRRGEAATHPLAHPGGRLARCSASLALAGRVQLRFPG